MIAGMEELEAMFRRGLQYSITLRRKDKIVHHSEALLPLIPARVLAMTWDCFVDEQLELCREGGGCPMDCHCHVLAWRPDEPNSAVKLCTVLFHDLIKPKWKLEEVV